MVGDAALFAVGFHCRQPRLVRVDKDGHIRKLAGKQLRCLDLLIRHLLAQLTQVAEQVGIFILERRTAGGAIDDDGVHILSGKDLQGIPDAAERGLPVSGHENGKTATGLVLGDDHLDPHLCQHIHHRLTDIAIEMVGGAAVEVKHAPPCLAFRLHHFRNGLGEGPLIEGRNPFHIQRTRVQFRFDPGTAEHLASPPAEPGRRGHLPFAGQKLEHHLLLPVDAVALRGPPADAGEEMVAVDAAGTIGHTGSTQQACREESLLHILGKIQPPFGKVAGKLHLSARRRLLHKKLLIYRTMGDAQTALDAVIDIFSGILTEQFLLFHDSIPSSSALWAGT